MDIVKDDIAAWDQKEGDAGWAHRGREIGRVVVKGDLEPQRFARMDRTFSGLEKTENRFGNNACVRNEVNHKMGSHNGRERKGLEVKQHENGTRQRSQYDNM